MRGSANRQGKLDRLLAQVQRDLANTDLAPIAQLLVGTITEVQLSVAADQTSRDDEERMVKRIEEALNSLPNSFNDRFLFDSRLIEALAAECSQGTASFSGMLIPKPSKAWGHETVPMPSFATGGKVHVVEVIHLPGEDKIEDINLLDYPFICHELGHNILFRHGESFIASFKAELDNALSSLQRQSLGIRGAAKQVADATITKMREFWTPTADHYNWAHEIAVDVVSLWLCGPAYLAALHDVMESEELDPFQLGKSHPPYELRAKALVEAAGQLGWAYYSGPTLELIERWAASEHDNHRTNLYVACAEPRLSSAAVSAAIQLCRLLTLPCCTQAKIASFEDGTIRDHSLDFGADLLLAAWWTYSRTTQEDFARWQRATITRLLED